MLRFFILVTSLFFVKLIISQSEIFTLQQAIESAIDKSPEIHQIDARIEAARNQWRIVSGVHSPEFSFFREGIGDTDEFGEQRLAVSQAFDFPLTVAYRHRALKFQYQALEFEKEHLERKIQADVKKSYVDVLISTYHLDLMNEQLKLAEEVHQIAVDKSQAGLGSDLELLKAQIAVAESLNDLEKGNLLLQVSRNQLIAITGFTNSELSQNLIFQDTLIVENHKLQLQQPKNLISSQPLYKSAQARLMSVSESLNEARSAILSEISASYYQQDFGNGYNFQGFEIGLKIPLWFPLERRGMINTAKAGITDLSWQMKGLEVELGKAIGNAIAGYYSSSSSIGRFNETIRARSQLLQELTIEAFRLGTVDLLHVLDARQTYLNSRIKYLDELKSFYHHIIEIERYWHETIVY